MLTHVHPSQTRFTIRPRPFLWISYFPTLCSGTVQGPPSAQSPFACSRYYLLQRDVQHHVGRHYPSFITHTDSCANPNPPADFVYLNTAGLCRLLSASAGRWIFPVLSLQSLYGRLDPYPAVSLRCFYPFLPEEHRPHLRPQRFGTPNYSLQCNFNSGEFFGAAVIPLCSGSHTR